MVERGLSKMQLCAALYGKRESGKIRTGSVYAVLNGTTMPSRKLIALLQEKAGLDLSGINPEKKSKGRPRAITTTPARTALAAFEAAKIEPVPVRTVATPARPPRFSLVIDQAGKADVILNLTGIKTDEALRILAGLTAAGVLHGNNDR
jgi:hypothetical protein